MRDTEEFFSSCHMNGVVLIAQREWERMKANNSQECRNCHNFADMDFTQQKGVAAKIHAMAEQEGKTCIDCHKGIAHSLPHMEGISQFGK